jgi:hypothetical protein
VAATVACELEACELEGPDFEPEADPVDVAVGAVAAAEVEVGRAIVLLVRISSDSHVSAQRTNGNSGSETAGGVNRDSSSFVATVAFLSDVAVELILQFSTEGRNVGWVGLSTSQG